jgi:predicted transposase YbfD/YdcC
VKENQKRLLESCQKTAKEAIPVASSMSRTEGRNRHERRRVRVFDAVRYVSTNTKAGWSSLVASMMEVVRTKRVFDTRSKSWKKSREIAYYVSTNLFCARKCADAIRKHWWIENTDHYVRDVSMNEDWSRIRINPDRMAVMRSFGLNIMRANGVKNVSQELFGNGLSLGKLLTYAKLVEH